MNHPINLLRNVLLLSMLQIRDGEIEILINDTVSHSKYAAGPGFTHSHLSPASALLSTILGISLIYEGKNNNTN